MGKTAFSGPVYGAKSLLISVSGDIAAATDASSFVTLFGMSVPSYEDWYVTEMRAYRPSTHSTLSVFRLVDDSTVVADIAITSSLAAQSGSTIITPSAGEYEGQRIAAGSALSLTATAGSTGVASTGVKLMVYGYIRFINSTRGE